MGLICEILVSLILISQVWTLPVRKVHQVPSATLSRRIASAHAASRFHMLRNNDFFSGGLRSRSALVQNKQRQTFREKCDEIQINCDGSCKHFMEYGKCMKKCLHKHAKQCTYDIDVSPQYKPPKIKRNKNKTLLLIYRRENEFTNPLETDDGTILYEGDMILSEDQINAGYKFKKRGRKAESRSEYRWPDAVVSYVITESSQKDKDVIMEAIEHWMAKTCLKFVQVPKDSKFPHLIFKKTKGCSSAVGRQATKFPHGQPVSVGEGCEEMGLIAHEIGHAIGFYHEHSRVDRNDVIMVQNENIKPSHARNFYEATFINPMSIPYDLNSIMHYNSRSFTKNGKNTVITVDPWKQLSIGQREQLSYLDITLANKMYCEDKMPACSIKCQNNGITGSNCKCICPEEFEGPSCNQIKVSTCGGNVTQPKIITTPDYPNNYPEDSRCIWWITAPKNNKVKLYFENFDLMPRAEQDDVCEWDNLELRAKDKHDGELFCGDEQKGRTIISSENEIILLFRSEFGDNKGFKAKIEFIGTPQLTSRSGKGLLLEPEHMFESYLDDEFFNVPFLTK